MSERNASSAAGDLQARRSRRDRDGSRDDPAARRAAPSISRRKPTRRLLPVPIEQPVVPAAARLSLGRAVLDRAGRAGAARHSGSASSIWSRTCSRAAKASAFSDWRLPLLAALALVVIVAREAFGLARLATIEKLHRARRRCAAQRRSRGKPRHRAGPAQDRARQPATGAGAHRAAGPCRRHHRRRRPDPAGRARTDDAARSGGAPPGLVGRAARLDRHRRQPARVDRRAVRVRRVAAAGPATGAALRRTAGRARA